MTRRLLCLLAALCVAGSIRAENLSPVRVEALTCEHLTDPVGIGNRQPRLSWKLRSDRAGEVQTAWELRAASSIGGLKAGTPDLWDSGKMVSDQSILVPWAGKSLNSRSQVFWQVRVWDQAGRPTAWSRVASFELGLLDPATEWKGKWITANLPRYDIEQATLAKASWISAGSTASQAAAVRLAFELPTNVVVRSAVVDAAADGRITIYVNGHSTQEGFTSLTAPLHAEVGDQLRPGKNILAIGSAAVRRNIRHDRGEAGHNAIAARVFIELQDGRVIELHTNHDWKAAVAPGGDWFATNFDDSGWLTATVLAPYPARPSKYCNTTIGPGRYLRKDFTTTKPIAKARLYATALGVYAAYINGRRVSNDLLAPGWTDYTKRVMAQTYDVTRLIHSGRNAVGAVLGDGWYAGRLGWMGLAQYGSVPAFNAQLEITYTDGAKDVIATDDSWKAGPGEIVGADEQWGEVDDAQKAFKNWDRPTFNESTWTNAVVEEHSVALVPQLGPPVRELMELAPQRITRHGDAWIVDFGQNLVGHIRLAARGPAGATITVRHAEMLNPDGSLYTENLRTALATDRFTLAGKGRERFEPQFTFHGFRYVEITGYPGKLKARDLRAFVVGSGNAPTGTFESSNPDLNRLYENMVWSQRGNFLSVPTDCPQRDERLGWMGDAQVFAPTAACNAGVAAFFAKWLVDVDDGQGTNGDFADVSPRVSRPQPAMPVWGDAGVILPWVMFETYGDKAFLADNYPFMKRWVDFSERRSHHLILSGGVGDHLAPVRTPTEVVDTAYFAHSAQLVAKAAALLGKTDDAAKYDMLFHETRDAFDKDFVSTNGLIRGDTQTAYLLALQFGLLPENLRAAAAQRLTENVEQHGHVTGGFVGNGLICPVLTAIGRSDLAWKLVLTITYPSWLFSVKNGATTIWERWDGWTPERGFQDASMNSFNHYSLGSVGAWLYSGAAGIRPDESSPGYKHFFLAPQFTTRLTRVMATFDSPYGMIVSSWRAEGDQLLYDVTIPPNSSATLELPVPPQEVRQSGHPLPVSSDALTRLQLQPGNYHFSLPWRLLK
ncbi:MAG TPA: family 78 glycoside hydrolase catalytic domain [Verrucomicrobiae bacterium]|nr:family 78 glycoside hydrolase catalytic domain [Verrucomicrobiae bacterium]